MSKSKSDIRPEQARAPKEHQDREGATKHSGFQPSSKFAEQGSTDSETSVTSDQRTPGDAGKTFSVEETPDLSRQSEPYLGRQK
jgi:hypothetical protein